MKYNLTQRKANLQDLKAIVTLLMESDELNPNPESAPLKLDSLYLDAFHKIDSDKNHYLMVVEINSEIIGTCHLTQMPSLTLLAKTRLQIEGV